MLNTWIMALHKSIGAAIHGEKSSENDENAPQEIVSLGAVPGGQLKKM